MEVEKTPLRGKLLKAAPAVNCIFVQEMLGQVLLKKYKYFFRQFYNKTFVLNKNIDMVIVGPEDLLVNGIYDFFKQDDLLKKISVIDHQKRSPARGKQKICERVYASILYQQQNTNHLIK